jgi:exonuclease III
MTIQIRTLNIQHGGGKRAEALGEYLATSSADIVVLSEYRENASGRMIRDRLAQAGFKHWKSSNPTPPMNGVAVASKLPFTPLTHPPGGLHDLEARWLECDFSDFRLVATYFPADKVKLDYWKWFMPQARSRADKACIFVGDFNTGKHRIDEIGTTFLGSEYMTEMESGGWIDAWRHLNAEGREYTWRSGMGGEFRLDYVWLSRPMVGWLRHAGHDYVPRSSKIADRQDLVQQVPN